MNGNTSFPEASEVAKREIAALVITYCRSIDRGDATALAHIFHDDSTVLCGIFEGRGPQFATEICRIVQAVFDRTLHSITEQSIEVTGETATGETRIVAISTLWDDEGQSEIVSGGRYLDRFERRDGVWKFAEHKVVSEWSHIDRIASAPDRQLDGRWDGGAPFGLDDPVDFRLQ